MICVRCDRVFCPVCEEAHFADPMADPTCDRCARQPHGHTTRQPHLPGLVTLLVLSACTLLPIPVLAKQGIAVVVAAGVAVHLVVSIWRTATERDHEQSH
jgi:hypothetical protein